MLQFEEGLKDLKSLILKMGGHVEVAIEASVRAILERNASVFSQVFAHEEQINQAHVEVDDLCLRLLARQTPLARDLRLILGVIKINTDLERMGDQAVNIAYNGTHVVEGAPLQMSVDLKLMSDRVRSMVRDALDAFVRGDVPLARQVLLRDDEVDQMKRSLLQELKGTLRREPECCEEALALILIGRNLERLGDHATNIAEDVIFVTSGEDVRHLRHAPKLKTAGRNP
jgi:phosphate transport system protein